MSRLAVEWRPLDSPRIPVAVLAHDEAARSLAAAVSRRRASANSLRVASSQTALLVLGPEEHLPWVDEATYLGREAGLLLPTTLQPTLPADLLRQAVRPLVDGDQIALMPGRIVAFSPSGGPVDPNWLLAYARGGAP